MQRKVTTTFIHVVCYDCSIMIMVYTGVRVWNIVLGDLLTWKKDCQQFIKFDYQILNGLTIYN